MTAVACPVALHPGGMPRRIPVYLRADGQLQLVYSDMPSDAHPDAIAARALHSQSGLETRAALSIGTSDAVQSGILWHFSLCRIIPPVRDHWAHLPPDGSGLRKFHWLPFDESAPAPLSEPSHQAIAWLRATL
jgi:hypothetical protein